jgi:O-antigen/teichoic acid export membrane protein
MIGLLAGAAVVVFIILLSRWQGRKRHLDSMGTNQALKELLRKGEQG